MFLTLLLVTFLVSSLACFIVVRIFDKPIQGILNRIVADDISDAWLKYVKFRRFSWSEFRAGPHLGARALRQSPQPR